MKPTIYYDPQNTSACTVHKSVVRMILAIAVNRQYCILHLDIKSTFTPEPYASRYICIKRIPRWNGSYTHLGKLIGRLHLNLYLNWPKLHIFSTSKAVLCQSSYRFRELTMSIFTEIIAWLYLGCRHN